MSRRPPDLDDSARRLTSRRVRAGLASSLVLASALLLLTPSDAAAYIDPSSGGLLLQLILGGTAGVAMLGKLYYRKVLGFFRRRPAAEQDGPGDAARPER